VTTRESGRIPASEARDAALEAILQEELQFAATPLTRRLYVCDRCGHGTVTVGYALPQGSRCHMRIRDQGPDGALRSTHRRNGRLEGQLLELGDDVERDERYGYTAGEPGDEAGGDRD